MEEGGYVNRDKIKKKGNFFFIFLICCIGWVVYIFVIGWKMRKSRRNADDTPRRM